GWVDPSRAGPMPRPATPPRRDRLRCARRSRRPSPCRGGCHGALPSRCARSPIEQNAIRETDESEWAMTDIVNVDYSTKIPNNVGLTEDRTVLRALEGWHPGYIDWWKTMGPEGFQEALVYLRTAVSVDP